jgi:RNA polymerase sigma factor (TIGR02999 family)
VTDVTLILAALERGEQCAPERLLPLVYEELRALAHRRMSKERSDHTLQATALVHEAYARLVGSEARGWASRVHFFAAAAEAMRRILIDSARRRRAARHGGQLRRIDLDDHLPAADVDSVAMAEHDELLALSHALDRLTAEDERKADLVKLHFFGGLSLEEAGEVLGLSRATAYRQWTYARAWLKDAMASSTGTNDS